MVSEPIKLCLGPPIPDQPVMVDYHSLPKPVVGERIKNVLEPLHIGGTQLIPAHIPVGDDVYDYWLLLMRLLIMRHAIADHAANTSLYAR